MLDILNVAHHSPSQQKIVVLTLPLIHLTKEHWIPYNFCPSYYSALIFTLPPCAPHLSFTELLLDHAKLCLLLYLCRFCFFYFCPTFSSSECLLIQDSAQAPSPPRSFCWLQTQTGIRDIFGCFQSTPCSPQPGHLNQCFMVVCLLSFPRLKTIQKQVGCPRNFPSA